LDLQRLVILRQIQRKSCRKIVGIKTRHKYMGSLTQRVTKNPKRVALSSKCLGVFEVEVLLLVYIF